LAGLTTVKLEITKQKGQNPFPTAGFASVVYLLFKKRKDSALAATVTKHP